MASAPSTVQCMPACLRRWPRYGLAAGLDDAGADEQAALAEPVRAPCPKRHFVIRDTRAASAQSSAPGRAPAQPAQDEEGERDQPPREQGTVPGSADSQDNHDGSDGRHRYSGPGGQGAVSGSPGASGAGHLRDGQGRKAGHQAGQVLPGPRAECLAGPLAGSPRRRGGRFPAI
jgi:hypothetical protein